MAEEGGCTGTGEVVIRPRGCFLLNDPVFFFEAFFDTTVETTRRGLLLRAQRSEARGFVVVVVVGDDTLERGQTRRLCARKVPR